ncbi:hypothetical protein [Kitasatospora indigofera]|uniref:hypothetical protein n=1 Tax=Kitasatospora indigofera TaxID=67307 RepID=UPI0036C99A5F
MEPVKSYEPARLLLVALGVLFLLLSAPGLFRPSVGGQVFSAVVVVLSASWCVVTARLGLVVDRNGIAEGVQLRPRRTPWQDVEEVAVREGRGSKGTDYWLVELRLRDGRELVVRSTASSDRKRVEDTGRRILGMRAAALGTEDPEGLAFREGNPDQKYGAPLGDAVVGPDGVPVTVRLRGPDSGQLDWSAASLPGGLLAGLVFAVLTGVGTAVSALVRRIGRRPGYRLTVEVGGPEPRSVTLPFNSRALATRHVRSLVAAVGEQGAAAVPRTAGAR